MVYRRFPTDNPALNDAKPSLSEIRTGRKARPTAYLPTHSHKDAAIFWHQLPEVPGIFWQNKHKVPSIFVQQGIADANICAQDGNLRC